MNPIDIVVIDVNEKEEEFISKELNIVKQKIHGSVYDGAVQNGTIAFADKKSNLNSGDKVWFHHRLIDTEKRKQASSYGKTREELKDLGSFRNYDWSNFGISNTAYIVEKGSEDERVGWGEWILAVEKDGKLKPRGDYSICKSIDKKAIKSSLLFTDISAKKETEPNLVEVVESNIYNKGTILIKKKDADYPMDISGEELIFIKNRGIVGTIHNGTTKANNGWVIISAIDEKNEWHNNSGVILHTKQMLNLRGKGTIAYSGIGELNTDDVVNFRKSSYQTIELNNKKYYAAQLIDVNFKYSKC